MNDIIAIVSDSDVSYRLQGILTSSIVKVQHNVPGPTDLPLGDLHMDRITEREILHQLYTGRARGNQH